jgi:hypothetical protein
VKKVILFVLCLLILTVLVNGVSAETFTASFPEGCIGCLDSITKADTVIRSMSVPAGTIEFTIDTKVLPRRTLEEVCGPTDFYYRGWDQVYPQTWYKIPGDIITRTGTPKSSGDPDGVCGIDGQQHIIHMVTQLKLDKPITLEVAMDPSVEYHGGGPAWQYGQQKEITITYKVVGGSTTIPVTTVSQSPTGCSFTGTWDTDWGPMTLTQSGNQVTGTYEHDNGRFTGTVTGSTVRGTWSESPSYAPPNDAGDAELTLGSNCKSFSGLWRYGTTGAWGSSASWDGTWTGSLKSAPVTQAPVTTAVTTTPTTRPPTTIVTTTPTTSRPATTAKPVTVVTTAVSTQVTKGCTGSGTSIYVDDRIMNPGQEVVIPIMICNANDIANMDLSVRYDNTALQFKDAVKGSLNANTLFESNNIGNTVKIAFAGKSGFSGSGSIAVLTFKVIGSNGASSPITVTVDGASTSGGTSVTIPVSNGKVSVGNPNPNDPGGRGKPTSLDALIALQISVGKRAMDSNYDVTKDGNVNSNDAREILKLAVQ